MTELHRVRNSEFAGMTNLSTRNPPTNTATQSDGHSTLEAVQQPSLKAVYDSPDFPPRPSDGAHLYYEQGDTGLSAKQTLHQIEAQSEDGVRAPRLFFDGLVCGMRMKRVLVVGIGILLVAIAAIVGGVVGTRKQDSNDTPTPIRNESTRRNLSETIRTMTEYPMPANSGVTWSLSSSVWYTFADYWYGTLKIASPDHPGNLHALPPHLQLNLQSEPIFIDADTDPEALERPHFFTENFIEYLGKNSPLFNWQFLVVPNEVKAMLPPPKNGTVPCYKFSTMGVTPASSRAARIRKANIRYTG